MSALDLLTRLRRLGVRVRWADQGPVLVDPGGVVDDETRRELARRAGELRALLGGPSSPAADPMPRPSRGEAPASFAQRRLWFLDRLEPGTAAYNQPLLLSLAGPLDVAALRRSLGELVRRHEILRTAYAARDGEPVQVVLPPAPPPLETVDVSAAADAGAEVVALAQDAALAPLDLAAGQVLRAVLFRVAPRRHWLLLCVHHIATDGWSTAIMRAELAALYGAYASGGASPLSEPPVQYADFAAWQRGQVGTPVYRQHLEYWRERLAGIVPPALPGARPRPAALSHRGERLRFEIDRTLAARLREIAREGRATLFVGLLAAFKALLVRTTGTTDIVVGAPAAGRPWPELERSLGLFVDSLVLRTDLSGEPTFRELLGRVRTTVVAALEHRGVPFDRLVDEVRAERLSNRNPLFDVMFSYRAGDDPCFSFGDLDAIEMPLDLPRVKFDLALVTTEIGGVLSCCWQCSHDVFDGGAADRQKAWFETLLAAAAERPDAPLSELRILPDAERLQVLGEWSRASAARSADCCVHELVEEQAGRTPHAIAIEHGERSLSYGELSARSGALAALLGERGVGSGHSVAIELPRSPEAVVAILAVLECGGCYVPLDPDLPLERRRFMVQDSGAGTLIGTSAAAQALGDLVASTVIVEAGARTGPVAAATQARRAAGGDFGELAYVIYTSGSTGIPKGVMVRHDGLANCVHAVAEAFGISSADRFLQFASLGYDASVVEIFLPLTRGATLVIYDGDRVQSATSLLSWCGRARLTVMFLPTALWGKLTADPEALSSRLPKTVRLVQIAGEEATPGSLARWRASVGDRVRLVNAYGPTEATIAATWAELHDDDVARGTVPIGRPFANVRVYVLDGRGEPVPIGVAGELCIGGAGVTAGYRNRPELTAERFGEDPFAGAGARLYRTRDVARWGADGQLEFLGRADDQVKVRGHRVEPGEVEAVLARHPFVQRAAVVARHDAAGGTELAAYLEPVPGRTPGLHDVRAHLAAVLPSAMIPGSFGLVDALPVNTAGKVDRRALLTTRATPLAEPAAVAARNELEATLAAIWSKVLHRDRVGVFDDFFALGGHSLRALDVAARASGACGVEVPVRALFEAPTVAGLAHRIEALLAARKAGVPHADASAERVCRDEPAALSFDQERVWFVEQLEPERALYNVPIAYRLDGEIDSTALGRALTEVVRRHEVLRTTYATVGGSPRQRIGPPVEVPVRVVELAATSDDAEGAAVRLAAEIASEPFDLAADLMIRAALIRFAPARSVLLLTLHHIAADGPSAEILTRELSRLYGAFVAGQEAPALDALPMQFADFAAWQRSMLSDEVLATEIAWWRRTLGDVPLLELPADRPRPKAPTREGRKLWSRLPAGTCDAVHALARERRTTTFRVLAALFAALLHRMTGNGTVVFGTPVRGRLRPDLEGLVGMFVNTVPMVVDLSDGPTFLELVERVDAATLDALNHQRLPFERLVDALRPGRDLARNPLITVMFGHTHGAGARVELPGLAVEKLDLDRGLSKFDLTLETRESEGEIIVRAEFSTELFERESVERLVERYGRLTVAALAAPDTPVAALPLLDEAERHTILEDWGWTAGAYPSDLSVGALFARQVVQRADAVALVDGEKNVTYGELDARAAVYAAALRALGVAAGELVGLRLARSSELVAAMLGVLAAGAAYLPIAVDEPIARVALIAGETGARLVVMDGEGVAELRAAGTAVATLPELASAATGTTFAPAWTGDAESTAYVMYTSGSTGVPKGIAVPHRAIARLVIEPSYVDLGPDDAVGFLSNPAFDASTFEVWGALLNGARLVVFAPDDVLDPARFAERVRSASVTVAFLTTALFNELVVSAPAALGGLRVLLFGGEAAAPDRVRRLLEDAPPRRLVHVYGPTESTTFATAYEVREVPDGAVTVPIGRPVSGTRCVVLDGSRRPVPIGVPGELYIGGDGLANGYVGNEPLTRERFVADPFAGVPDARLYRTGDLVRWRVDGQLDFVGRTDDQVKLRGFRIEPGEIAAVLRRHPAVRDAVVVARRDRAGELMLVGYAVPTPAATVSGDELRRHLQAALPPYMAPVAIVTLSELPLTANGKVDTRALPAPPRGGGSAAPATALEKTIAAVFSEVLGVERIGVDDDFFESGGHSLLAVRLVGRLRDELSLPLRLRDLFVAPTVQALAVRVLALRLAAAGGENRSRLLGDDQGGTG